MVPGGVPFPMLSDPAGEIGRVYGVYDKESGVDIRGRFIIDPDGVIQAMEMLTPPVGRNADELIRQIKAFQHVRNTGEVTPSGWQPGDQTLRAPARSGRSSVEGMEAEAARHPPGCAKRSLTRIIPPSNGTGARNTGF